MSQHDMNIANQGFPSFRSDLNNALAALVSNSSGATAPATTFAHQMWVDTSANPSVLKIRNADNDAFITIGTINQTGDTFTLTSAVSATTLNTSGAVVFNDAGANVDFRVEGDTDANLLFVDASADRVGIGTNTPDKLLNLRGANPILRIDNTTGGGATFLGMDATSTYIQTFTQDILRFITAGSERMRIDSSGNVLINTTLSGGILRIAQSVDDTTGGLTIYNTDGAGGVISYLTGNNMTFRVAGAERMRIDSSGNILPGADDAQDLGSLTKRYDDIYATNGTIQTSDRNEKQDIEALSEAETRVAVAAKGLLKKYRWKSAVAEKGDDARIHFGIIAQDLKAAFEAEGLDAGRYAMFIHSAWWEHEVEVPAVEAKEAVYETQTDEEGNEVQVLVSEAVEGKDAYIRTDTYPTEEEASEGAVRKERMGIRYNELLAFIIAAL